ASRVGTRGPAADAIVGDLVLAHCLEAQRHSADRAAPIIRAYPVHYFASWLDLPAQYVDVRGLSDMLAAILAAQPDGDVLRGPQGPGEAGAFPLGRFQENLLLRSFGEAVESGRKASSLTADSFSAGAADGLSVEQTLMVRIAEAVGEAPKPAPGDAAPIANQLPLARVAAEEFGEDFRVLLAQYGDSVPLDALMAMLETSLAVGLTVMVLASAQLALSILDTYQPVPLEVRVPLFVDASAGSSRELRDLAEESMAHAYQVMRRLPTCFMTYRVLEQLAEEDPHLEGTLPPSTPHGRDRIVALARLLDSRHPRAAAVSDQAARQCRRLGSELSKSQGPEDVMAVLQETAVHPVQRLADGLARLMGYAGEMPFVQLLSSSLVSDEASPNRLVVQRRVRKTVAGVPRSADARALVLSNTTLDYLVHRHLWAVTATGACERRALTLAEFLKTLRLRYGLFVDVAPPGMPIAADLLRTNRLVLEQRLRDLGLLVGVNDSESMKLLQPRFHHQEVHDVRSIS
ncbi:MAG: hypothetical protein M0Z36_09695, partial [Thermaerobacter sp.]|nr:hypothetical protein [Thermaerobacter sp.]